MICSIITLRKAASLADAMRIPLSLSWFPQSTPSVSSTTFPSISLQLTVPNGNIGNIGHTISAKWCNSSNLSNNKLSLLLPWIFSPFHYCYRLRSVGIGISFNKSYCKGILVGRRLLPATGVVHPLQVLQATVCAEPQLTRLIFLF